MSTLFIQRKAEILKLLEAIEADIEHASETEVSELGYILERLRQVREFRGYVI